MVRQGRLTVAREEGFVVLLIGARANHWWNLPIGWAVARAMTRMVGELLSDPDAGLLSYESYFGRTTLMVQYWRSIEDLHRYAQAPKREHGSAWRAWIKNWGKGAVGIWHETYIVEPGSYECVYVHMPEFGLGQVGPLVPATGPLKTSEGRIRAGAWRHQS